jgi:hypothetical protein
LPTTIYIPNPDLAIVTDDEDDTHPHPTTSPPEPTSAQEDMHVDQPTKPTRKHTIKTDFTEPIIDIRDDSPTYLDDHQEYMHWHYKLYTFYLSLPHQ